jgi:hypothetical protein
MPSFSITSSLSTDILVIGAGSAGCVAAIAAGRKGSYKVMLVERYGFPGGSSTQMLDTFYGFFTPGNQSKKIVGGYPDLVVDSLNNYGEVFLRPNTYGAGTGVNYNPERLKNVWDQLILESNVTYLLHSTLIAVEKDTEGNFSCIFWSKAGFTSVSAKKVIDASGDADFCHLAGYEYETAGQLEPAQSMTTTFRMANVDLQAYEAAGGKKNLQQLMAATQAPLPRKEGSAHEMNIPKSISTVAVKVANKNALSATGLTEAEVEGRRQAFVYEDFFKKEVPGYYQSKISGLSHQIGVRETRRVYGESRLTKEQCLSAFVPEDTILLCGAPIEDHNNNLAETNWEYIPNNGVYGVSYGCIVPKNSEDVWVIGRCFSATHDAHASCRSMAQTMAMGQAAGLAAVLSLNSGKAANKIDIKTLQKRLIETGAILSLPSELAFIGREDWSKNSSKI